MQERPDLALHLGFVWEAWWELGTDRPIGMATGPIPFSAIDGYARRYGLIDVDQFLAFSQLIRAMDEVYLDWAAKQKTTS